MKADVTRSNLLKVFLNKKSISFSDETRVNLVKIFLNIINKTYLPNRS